MGNAPPFDLIRKRLNRFLLTCGAVGAIPCDGRGLLLPSPLAPVLEFCQFVQTREHRILIDPKVDQTSHLINAYLLESFHHRQTSAYCPHQTTGLIVALKTMR